MSLRGNLEAGEQTSSASGGSIPTLPLHSHQKRLRHQHPEPMLVRRLTLLSPLITLSNGLLFGVIPRQIGARFIERYEWLGHAGRAFKNYGMWDSDGFLYGVEAFQPPALGLSRALGQMRSLVLSRGACVLLARENAASTLISACIRDLRKQGFQFVCAFADPSAGEHGGAYLAANARFLGYTKTRQVYWKIGERRVSGQRLYQEGIPKVETTDRQISPERKVYGWLLDRNCNWPSIWAVR